MSRFEFGLQKVLELREQEEKAQARALAEAERRAEEAESNLALLRKIRQEEAEKLMRAHSEGRSVGQLRNLDFVIRQIEERMDAARMALREAAERVSASREELVAIMTRRRVLDQLRERKENEWRVGQIGLEQKQMDELALGRFQRRGSELNGSGS